MLKNVCEGLNARKCIWRLKCSFRSVFIQRVFLLNVRLACLLSFASLLNVAMTKERKKHFQQLLHIKCPFVEPGPTVRKYLLGPVELDGRGQSLACVPLTMVPGRIRAGQVASSGLPASIFLIGTNIIGRLMKGGSVSWPIGLVVCNVHHPD